MTPEQAELKAMGFEIPDSITPIVACRSWVVRGGRLASHNSTLWVPGEAMKARCALSIPAATKSYHQSLTHRYGERQAPGEDLNPADIPMKLCSCGIYAAKHEEANRIVPCSPLYVHGEVYLWGRILEGPRGYRAEYAYPKRFFVKNEITKAVVENMGFGVPVIVVERFDHRFPFPLGKGQRRIHQALGRINRLSPPLLLLGLPPLVVGVVDSLTLDMSRLANQLVVSLTAAVGLLVTSLSLYLLHLQRKMEKKIGINNVRVNGVPIKITSYHHRLRAKGRQRR